MTIRNKDTFMQNLWDWGFLDDCFGGTRIRITDVDGLVERKGHFLLIETKSPGKDIPRGQQILFDAIAKQPNWHILVIWGLPNVPTMAQIWGCKQIPADEMRIREIVRRWYEYANREAWSMEYVA